MEKVQPCSVSEATSADIRRVRRNSELTATDRKGNLLRGNSFVANDDDHDGKSRENPELGITVDEGRSSLLDADLLSGDETLDVGRRSDETSDLACLKAADTAEAVGTTSDKEEDLSVDDGSVTPASGRSCSEDLHKGTPTAASSRRERRSYSLDYSKQPWTRRTRLA